MKREDPTETTTRQGRIPMAEHAAKISRYQIELMRRALQMRYAPKKKLFRRGKGSGEGKTRFCCFWNNEYRIIRNRDAKMWKDLEARGMAVSNDDGKGSFLLTPKGIRMLEKTDRIRLVRIPRPENHEYTPRGMRGRREES